ncbi:MULTISPECIES: HlyD family type I secretion periplasmic adaptor subunit [unclassified Mesorhizobium]|uniref:HlyD family type I secretion periplasmic adaptor subunit n=1 Tax=unclassified Mesorhizobium TaxID=325217 RepID=UPI000F76034A|nr:MULTISPECIES: HlyD family type I secretion periplasmic adaptor subunit [unclassified Mesorhizobium]AZO58664.1 HlyD family type I secretion periplasmic adaptor subunit [Mesorhizobium sp. M1A.F.Ca.IN.022.06.1.1]MCT2579211.1 HlyD family type I secretion periplasmic adaptor subunit [Mesorhizobium sp. P13.3]MDF3168616.1 HlyD family type I secretion periplasmic adaptor subunit [Mesorhizobium sp. P16.1]MDF3178410.1 HlyD family type I secretion periplasmic adaptor subunit [Mesorhizobium sp. P17.1]M
MSSTSLTVRQARWGRAKTNDPTTPAILEFQWPSTAVSNAPIPRAARGIVWMISSLVIVLITVAGLIPVDQVVTTRGLVVSQSPNIIVQPLETAIVRSIEVREGQHVQAGQLLARLDSTFASADLQALAMQVSTLEAEVARLKAEADGKEFNYDGLDPSWTLQASIFERRKAVYEAKLENFDRQSDELTSVISRAQSDAAGYRQRLSVAASIEQMRKQLEERQVGSRLNTLLAEDNSAEMSRALGNAVQTAEAARRQQAAVAADRAGYIQGWRAEVSQGLSEASSRMSDARELFNKAKLRKQLVELKSEGDAIVQSVAKVSVGSVLQSGERLITLVPAKAPLEIETNVVGRSSGFVHVGDPVVIKFDTFPYSQYGLAHGTVRTLSPDSFSAQEQARDPDSSLAMLPSNTEPFYRTRISIDQVALHDVPAGFALTPGMPVTADVQVGRRTVLKYMLGVMLPIGQEAMREP